MKTKFCNKCGKEKPIKEFSWRNKNKGIKASNCKECHKKYSHNHYIKNKEAYIEKAKKWRYKMREWFNELKGNLKCEICGEDHISCLDFHHENLEEKEINVSQTLSRGWSKKRILEEINKCTILCSNCHRKLHWRLKHGGDDGT